jgi:peptidoglycan/LPS O-acetylase OafA/YrhL
MYSTSGYRADVDGLRAIAVLAVLFFHARIGCSGGFVGVDVFFVISGYLITRLILKELEEGRFSIRKFWERRIRRILPALAVVVCSCLLVSWFVLLPRDYHTLGNAVSAQAILLSNVFFWRSTGYFAASNDAQPLLHTWSLAVEEQFYLLFPAVLTLVFYRLTRRRLVTAILLLSGISYVLSLYGSYMYPDAAFYLLPARAWELGTGVLLAATVVRRTPGKWLAEIMSWSGLIAIAVAVFSFNRDTRFPGFAALLPVLGTAMLIRANDVSLTYVGKLLAARPVVFVGLISYSLYLWHWPVLVFSQYGAADPLPVALRLLLLAVSVAIAALSWRFIETPFRKRVILQSQVRVFAFAGVTLGVLLVAGVAIRTLQGMPSRIPPAAMEYVKDVDRAFINEVSLQQALAGDFVELGTRDKHKPISIFVWGDSHAMAVMPALDSLCKKYSVRGIAATHSSTCPLVGFRSLGKYSLGRQSPAFNNAVVRFIRSRNIRDVILVGHWATYLDEGDLYRAFTRTLITLENTGARVWIMKEVPEQRCTRPPITLACAVMRHYDPETLGVAVTDYRQASRTQDEVFKRLTHEFPNVAVLDPATFFVAHNNQKRAIYRMAENGKSLYADSTHLTVIGALQLRPLLKPIFIGYTESARPQSSAALN